MNVSEWEASGAYLDTPDGRVFYARRGDTHIDEAVVLLHGFPTASWDFCGVIDALAEKRAVVTFDFLGFGLSDKPERFGYSLFEHADTTALVLRELGVRRAHVIAHDMGTSVTTELLARRERGLLPFEIASVVLMNGSVHIDLAHLTPGQKLLRSPLGGLFARLSTKRSFAMQLRRLFARPLGDAELDAMWALVSRADGALRLPKAIGYVGERWRFERRWIGALERLEGLPLLVAWGRKDPVAVYAIADAIAQEVRGAERVTWDELSHWPQVEDPKRVGRDLIAFLDRAASR